MWARLLVVAAIPAIMLVRNLLQYLSIYLTNWSANHAIGDIRTQLFAHLQNLSLGFSNRPSTGRFLIARITNDTAGAVRHHRQFWLVLGGEGSHHTIFCLIGAQLMVQPKLTLVSVVVFPVCLVPIIIFGRKVRRSARAVQMHNAELTNLMHESFTGTRVIKAYNLEATVTDQFRATTRKYLSQVMRVVRANEIPSQLMEIFGATGIALVFFYVVNMPIKTAGRMKRTSSPLS